MLIAHEALSSPREEPVGRSALGGRVADVDRYLPRRWTHCSQHRCFQPRRLVPGRCSWEQWPQTWEGCTKDTSSLWWGGALAAVGLVLAGMTCLAGAIVWTLERLPVDR